MFTRKEIEYLKSIGTTDEEMNRIEEAIPKTRFYFNSDEDTKEKRLRKVNAMKMLGMEKFLLGMKKSTFHWTARIDNVFFDSSEIFK